MQTPLDKLAGREFGMSSFELRQTERNKPNVAKAIIMNSMTEKSAKQTQPAYSTCYQLLTAILAPISEKFGSKGRGSPLGIRVTPRGLALQINGVSARRNRRRWEGFTSKPTMSFRMSKSENDRPINNSGTIESRKLKVESKPSFWRLGFQTVPALSERRLTGRSAFACPAASALRERRYSKMSRHHNGRSIDTLRHSSVGLSSNIRHT